MIIEMYPLGPIETNGILFGCPKTKVAALVDAPFGSEEIYVKRVEALGFTVGMILFTHSHWDHIAEAAQLKKRYNVPVAVHPLDAPGLRKPGSDGLRSFEAIEGVEPDRLFEDGERFKVGELEIEVIHTPGHSPGCVCFYIEKEGVLITGDTLFNGSIGRTDLPTSNPDDMWPSLKRLAKLPPETRIYPGHRDESTLGKQTFLENAKEIFGDRRF